VQSYLSLDAQSRKRMSGRARLTPFKNHCNIRVATFVAKQFVLVFLDHAGPVARLGCGALFHNAI
jgi:hypothetical protein